jgi:hypothetical protein
MHKNIEEVLTLWHEHFSDEANQYSEFEHSDIEYFVGCLLYNHFAFSKALHTMKTMDLSYDFLSHCGDKEYDRVLDLIVDVDFDEEKEKLAFLQEYIKEAKAKYSKPELYLLDRLEYHIHAMAERYEKGVDNEHINFMNPLLRK